MNERHNNERQLIIERHSQKPIYNGKPKVGFQLSMMQNKLELCVPITITSIQRNDTITSSLTVAVEERDER